MGRLWCRRLRIPIYCIILLMLLQVLRYSFSNPKPISIDLNVKSHQDILEKDNEKLEMSFHQVNPMHFADFEEDKKHDFMEELENGSPNFDDTNKKVLESFRSYDRKIPLQVIPKSQKTVTSKSPMSNEIKADTPKVNHTLKFPTVDFKQEDIEILEDSSDLKKSVESVTILNNIVHVKEQTMIKSHDVSIKKRLNSVQSTKVNIAQPVKGYLKQSDNGEVADKKIALSNITMASNKSLINVNSVSRETPQMKKIAFNEPIEKIEPLIKHGNDRTEEPHNVEWKGKLNQTNSTEQQSRTVQKDELKNTLTLEYVPNFEQKVIGQEQQFKLIDKLVPSNEIGDEIENDKLSKPNEQRRLQVANVSIKSVSGDVNDKLDAPDQHNDIDTFDKHDNLVQSDNEKLRVFNDFKIPKKTIDIRKLKNQEQSIKDEAYDGLKRTEHIKFSKDANETVKIPSMFNELGKIVNASQSLSGRISQPFTKIDTPDLEKHEPQNLLLKELFDGVNNFAKVENFSQHVFNKSDVSTRLNSLNTSDKVEQSKKLDGVPKLVQQDNRKLLLKPEQPDQVSKNETVNMKSFDSNLSSNSSRHANVNTKGITKAVPYKPVWESLDSRPIPNWYNQAKLGILIHWGVYSVPGFASEMFWWKWKGPSPDPSVVHFMEKYYPELSTYRDFVKNFTSELFNATEWAYLFKECGAQYVVLTSKHHDGFTLWPTNTSKGWNSMEVGPRKDLVGQLESAIRSTTNLKFGVYYSLMEWFNNLFLEDKTKQFLQSKYVDMKVLPELQDLVNNYSPDILWMDGDFASEDYWKSKEFLTWLYNESKVKNTVVTNDRWGNGSHCKHGGFFTCPDQFHTGTSRRRKWEKYASIDNLSRGYRSNVSPTELLSTHEILSLLVTTVSKGGNLLVNVGATKEGLIPPMFQKRLKEIGNWLKINGEGIYSSQPWKVQNDNITNNVYYSSVNNTIYAFVIEPPDNSKSINLGIPCGLETSQVYLLGWENTNIIWNYFAEEEKRGLSVQLPTECWESGACNSIVTLKLINFQ